jgi:hypothetical protein
MLKYISVQNTHIHKIRVLEVGSKQNKQVHYSCDQGILKGEVLLYLLFDWFGLVILKINTKIVSCHTTNSKPVK